MMDLKIPNIGSRTMAHAIDELAEKDPGRRVCRMPESPDNPRVFFDLGIKQLAHAINYMSWWIEKEFGKGDSYSETVAYLGANDVRYLVMVVACNKTGYKVCLFPIIQKWTNKLIFRFY